MFGGKKDDRPTLTANVSTNDKIEPPPVNLKPSIEIKNLYKAFGTYYALNGVNLRIYEKEIIALLGPNGAGKTTTMSILTGIMLGLLCFAL